MILLVVHRLFAKAVRIVLQRERERVCACVGSCCAQQCACVRRPARPLRPVPLETFALLVEDVGVEQHMCSVSGLFGKFVAIIAVFFN